MKEKYTKPAIESEDLNLEMMAAACETIPNLGEKYLKYKYYETCVDTCVVDPPSS